MSERLKILYAASECAPFAKTGGLGDVVAALPKALLAREHEVRVMLPLYAGMDWDSQELLEGSLEVPMGYGKEYAGVRLGKLPHSRVPVYFIEHRGFFDRAGIYGDEAGGFGDNIERYAFFSRAVMRLCAALGWIPDVLHANDWQTGLCPVFGNTMEKEHFLGTASVLTIHNLAHQGRTGRDDFGLLGLFPSYWDPDVFEHDDDLNLLKAGLRHATMISTVSPTYAQEIQSPELGRGLDYVLRERRADVWGILNGIDTEVWNPALDPNLPANYDVGDLSGKAVCKREVQRELGLPEREDAPLLALIARLDPQKGVDVVGDALPRLLDLDLQFAVLGTGDPEIEAWFGRVARERPDRFAARIAFDARLAHRLEAASDFFLMPSRFEPCGLNQMYSLAYGSLPIVRSTGGLVDTVQNYVEATAEGTGFRFEALTPQAIFDVVGWAVSTWYDRPEHYRILQRRAMEQDHSWDHSAGLYEQLYREALRRRRA